MNNDLAYDVLIVGAGLSGLVAAHTLRELAPGASLKVVEARTRPGGRILTVPTDVPRVQIDLGPTWVWPHQSNLQALLERLELSTFPQYDSGAALLDQGPAPARRFNPDWEQEPAQRIAGGVGAVIGRLLARLPAAQVAYGQVGQRVAAEGEWLVLSTRQGGHYRARQVIVTLPPRLATTLTYDPPLPLPVLAAMQQTQTWMGQAMKVALVYDRPFWREVGLSGLAVSYIGPVQQFHDATPANEAAGALFGWLGNQSEGRAVAPEARRQAVVEQAVRLFGGQAAEPLAYVECNWRQEAFTHAGEALPEVEHPAYGSPLLQPAQMDGRLHWASTEVSPVGGGYLEGAVYIGQEVAGRVARVAQSAG